MVLATPRVPSWVGRRGSLRESSGPGLILWPIGAAGNGGKAAWRITAVLELDSSVYDGMWEVEPIP